MFALYGLNFSRGPFFNPRERYLVKYALADLVITDTDKHDRRVCGGYKLVHQLLFGQKNPPGSICISFLNSCPEIDLVGI